MMFEEFVDFRVGAGDAVRQEREREQARQVEEHGRWLRSAARRMRAVAERAGGVQPAAERPVAAAVVEGAEYERELAHAAR
ncbi:hypothetical protein AB4Z18_05310 [Leifsonia sp. 2TAF2]|uniref:hypothetical protein n=1 Tax=Leifsonia sp. 2TAF2 TaxID=3233009 RepID=UPI003F9478FD